MRKALLLLTALLLLLAPLCADGVDTFCYDRLDNSGQLAYEAIYYCLSNLLETWNCGSIPQSTIQKAYDCILMDHPEIFWSDTYTYVTSYINNEITGHRIEFSYSLDAPAIINANHLLEDALLDIVREAGRMDVSYETVKAVFEYFVENCTYDEANMDQSMYSVMINRSGVCASFARSFEFVMQCLGIPCTVVRGRLLREAAFPGNTMGHEWNLIELDGNWYHVDITSAISVSVETGVTDYRFLCATTDEMLQTHVIDNVVPVPRCTDGSLNFFTYYGLSVSEYSREALAYCMLRAMDMGLGPVARFSNYRALTEAVEDLFTNKGIFQAITDATGLSVTHVSYSLDEQTMVLRLVI